MFALNYTLKALTTVFVAGVFAVSAPSSPATPTVALDAETNVNEFVLGSSLAEHAADASGRYPDAVLTIPVVYVFSPSGYLIYRETGDDRVDHESANEKSRALLEGLPGSAEPLSPMKGTPKLKAMLDFIPAFKEQEKSIIGNGH